METATKKPYPAMQNLATMTLGELNKIIKQFPAEKIKVTRGEIFIGVYTVKHDTELLTAALVARNRWHIRARAGLVSVKAK